jgi:SAM-dependent methyltransferase
MTGAFKKLTATLAAPPDPFLVTERSKRRVRSLIENARDGAVILNVGAGHTDYGPRVINLDIFDSGTTSVVASAQALPFPDSVADLVIMQGVLEHVEDADTTLKECIRALRPGGLFYTEMPFLQPYHESPIDMRRATRPGLGKLCEPLVEVESGIHIGPASTATWILRELTAGLLSGGDPRLHRRINSLVGWIVFPLKYADYFLERAPQFHRIASSCYYIGQKV